MYPLCLLHGNKTVLLFLLYNCENCQKIAWHGLNQYLLWHSPLCSRPWCATMSIMLVTNCLHLRGTNGLRRVIPACGMSSQTTWITKHDCTMDSGVGSRGLIWQTGPSRMLNGVQGGEYTDHRSVWTAFDLGKSCVKQIKKGKALCRNPMDPCITPLPILEGTAIQSSGIRCKLPEMITHGMCGYSGVTTSWQYSLWMVSTEVIGVWGEYANPLTVWFLGVAHYVGGSRWSQSLAGNVSTVDLLCVVHWNISCYLQSSNWFAAFPLTFFCRRWWGPSKLFILCLNEVFRKMSSLQVITDIQMHGLTKPHKCQCPILSQFHEGYVIHVWQLRYGQERGQWE